KSQQQSQQNVNNTNGNTKATVAIPDSIYKTITTDENTNDEQIF
ncbi:1201_t:CDS:1, partial [Ambispora leptoticha]